MLAAILLGLALAAHTAARGDQSRHLFGQGSSLSAVTDNSTDAPLPVSWLVSLRSAANIGEVFCSGTLIHPRIVMTAAQCPLPKKDAHYLPQAVIGAEVRRVIATAPHLDYGGRWFRNNDIALMLLEESSSLMPIQLPAFVAKPRLPLPLNTMLEVAAWWQPAANNTSVLPGNLQEARMQLLALPICEREVGSRTDPRSIFPSPANTMICAGNPPAYSTHPCKRDVGGPLFHTNSSTGVRTQIGIVSWGPPGCVGRRPDVFTNVAQLRPWIDKTAAELLAGEWTGRVWGEQLVQALDGHTSPIRGRPGDTLDILSAGTSPAKFTLSGTLINEPLKGLPVVGSIKFQGGASVQVKARGVQLTVLVNGRSLRAGRSQAVNGGSVQFSALKWGTSHSLVIEQPDLSIRITQPFSRQDKRFLPWLDVAVTLPRPSGYRLLGLLGDAGPVSRMGSEGNTSASAASSAAEPDDAPTAPTTTVTASIVSSAWAR